MKDIFKAINKLNIFLRILIYSIIIFGTIYLISAIISFFALLLD